MAMLTKEVPDQVGVILLPGVTLLPNNVVPLHIFEKRYCKMLADALDGDRMFAIANKIDEDETDDLSQCVDPVGVVGSIRATKELEGGRSVLMIEGISAVRFTEWKEGYDYPCAELELLEREEVDNPSVVRDLLMDGVQRHLGRVPKEIRPDFEKSLNNVEELTALIDFVAHHFIGRSEDRQFYLSETSDSARASRLLISLDQAADPE